MIIVVSEKEYWTIKIRKPTINAQLIAIFLFFCLISSIILNIYTNLKCESDKCIEKIAQVVKSYEVPYNYLCSCGYDRNGNLNWNCYVRLVGE